MYGGSSFVKRRFYLTILCPDWSQLLWPSLIGSNKSNGYYKPVIGGILLRFDRKLSEGLKPA